MVNLIKRCGLFFIFIFIYTVLYAEELSLELKPIIVSKSNVHLLDIYSLEYDFLKLLPFSSFIEALNFSFLDLQSRSPKADIQIDFSLRGSNFSGVLILLDGMRINDPQTAHHNCDIPLTQEDIERIEVIPGIGSSLFGSDAIGGAVNIIIRKPNKTKKVLEWRFGSYRTGSGLISITEKKGNLGIRFSLERQESDGFRYDTDFKELTNRFDGFLELPYGEFNLGLGYQEKEFGAYDFYTPGLGYPSKEWTKTFCLSTGLYLEKDGFIIKPDFLWRVHFDKFTLDKEHLDWYLNHHRTDVYTPQIYIQKEIHILGNFGLGLEYGEEHINSTRLGKHNRNHKSIFLDNSKNLNKIIFWGFSFRRDEFNSFGDIYTGSASLKVNPDTLNSFSFGISRSIRIPSFTELYYNDPLTEGDAGLLPEEGLTYQIGYDYKKENINISTVFFLREEKNFIDWVSDLSVPPTKWQARNITEAKVFGIENYFNLKIKQNINLSSYYTYVDKHIDSKGYLYKYGPNYVQHLFTTNLNFDFPLGKQFLGFSYKKKPGRDGWFLTHLGFSYNLNKNTLIYLKINNLFNMEYQEIPGIPQPGRWIETGVRFEW